MLIWYADVSDMTEEQMKKYLEELSEYRLEKVNRLRYEKDKKLSVAAGILLDRALKECHLSEKDCRYQIMEHGKVYLVDHPEIAFNISHSGCVAVLIFHKETKHDLSCGIDIELIQGGREKIVNRLFSEADKEQYKKLDPDAAALYFARVWTRMESFGKMTGKGLDFSDPTQKKIMDRSEMKKKNVYFREFRITDKTGREYNLCACADKEGLLEETVFSDKSVLFSSQNVDCVVI
ncbi:MAG: 4'-phosphopantetheinyl transferase superfamily protein [Coprococcus sp.]|jgi:4'-phosphopantetheinyl transferase|uniref:4'-phosphopantetheinyl transferase family protein n=2 Tax=Coprococcus sp. TaxID=2049024 RepID=UPI002E9AAA8F|nr:4'-phosphopantetheinyl transferase superfamily protein [Coprococcus sp.]